MGIQHTSLDFVPITRSPSFDSQWNIWQLQKLSGYFVCGFHGRSWICSVRFLAGKLLIGYWVFCFALIAFDPVHVLSKSSKTMLTPPELALVNHHWVRSVQ